MNIFKKAVPTVAGALAGFHKSLAELRAVKEHHDAEATKNESLIGKVQEEAAALIARVEASAQRQVAQAEAARIAAEEEAREAVKAIARVESFLGL